MRLNKFCGALLIVGVCQWSSVQAIDWTAGFIANLDVEKETHTNVSGERSIQKAELTLRPRLEARFSDDWSSLFSARLRSNYEDNIEPGKPNQDSRSAYNRRWFFGDRTEAELRDVYVNGKVGSALLRVGKQQIVWGQADGVRVLDVVNPFSFREFIIPDAEERRIPLWSIRTDIPVGASNVQLLWIIDPTYDDIPESTAAFAITTPLLIPQATPGANVTVEPVAQAPNTLRNSDAGARWSVNAGGWDLSANYLYHYYDDPVPAVEVSGATVFISPRYERTHLVGGSFANAFGSTTLRGEIGYSIDRWFITTDSHTPGQVFKSPELAWVVGVDNLSYSNTLLSIQYFQSGVIDNHVGMTRDRNERQVTVLIQRRFVNDAVTARALGLYSVNRRDAGVQARLSWALGTHWTVAASIDSYGGDRDGLFGEFHQASRWGLHLEWGS